MVKGGFWFRVDVSENVAGGQNNRGNTRGRGGRGRGGQNNRGITRRRGGHRRNSLEGGRPGPARNSDTEPSIFTNNPDGPYSTNASIPGPSDRVLRPTNPNINYRERSTSRSTSSQSESEAAEIPNEERQQAGGPPVQTIYDLPFQSAVPEVEYFFNGQIPREQIYAARNLTPEQRNQATELLGRRLTSSRDSMYPRSRESTFMDRVNDAGSTMQNVAGSVGSTVLNVAGSAGSTLLEGTSRFLENGIQRMPDATTVARGMGEVAPVLSSALRTTGSAALNFVQGALNGLANGASALGEGYHNYRQEQREQEKRNNNLKKWRDRRAASIAHGNPPPPLPPSYRMQLSQGELNELNEEPASIATRMPEVESRRIDLVENLNTLLPNPPSHTTLILPQVDQIQRVTQGSGGGDPGNGSKTTSNLGDEIPTPTNNNMSRRGRRKNSQSSSKASSESSSTDSSVATSSSGDSSSSGQNPEWQAEQRHRDMLRARDREINNLYAQAFDYVRKDAGSIEHILRIGRLKGAAFVTDRQQALGQKDVWQRLAYSRAPTLENRSGSGQKLFGY